MYHSVYFINTNEKHNHFTISAKGVIYYATNGVIFTCEDKMLFSRMNISRVRAKVHLVFHWCLYD